MLTPLNQIIDIMAAFASHHKQIAMFATLPSEEFISKNKEYPFFIIEPNDAEIGNGQIVITFVIYALDRVNKDDQNINNVLSNCMNIIEDFWVFFNENLDQYGFYLQEQNATMTRVAYMFGDMLAGYKLSVKCQVPMFRSEGQIPIKTPII
jgi:hypothetical protein